MDINRCLSDNLIVQRYFKEVPFYKWVDAYLKSSNQRYEPGKLMDTMKAVSNEFDEIKNEENLGDETKSLAFFDICELNEGGTYGYVRLAMTNPTFFGIEVKIAIKTIKQVYK